MNQKISSLKVYVINMPDQKKRLAHMNKLLSNLGFNNVEIVTPLPGDETDRQNLVNEGYLNPQAELGKNIISHISTYLSIMSSAREDYFIIMEDDLSFDINNLYSLDNLHNFIPEDFDCFFMEYCFESCSQTTSLQNGLIKMNSPLCLGAVIYKRESIGKILDSFISESRQLDHWFRLAIKRDQIKAYSTESPLFFQDKSFGTDLQNNFLFHVSNLLFGTHRTHCKETAMKRIFVAASFALSVYSVYDILYPKTKTICKN